MSNSTIYLIDANAYIHRAYHALPPLTSVNGEPVGAVYGFARMMIKMLKAKPAYLAVCFDTPAPTQRHASFAEYKATRKPTEEPLKVQLPVARELLEAWGIPCFSMDGYEADDLIATMAKQAEGMGLDVVIVSGDKDVLQLVTDKIHVLNESKNMLYGPLEVQDRYGVRPDQLVEIFGLSGDSVDNVPGVPGIGEKTAAKLIKKYNTIEGILNADAEEDKTLRSKIIRHKDQALLSRELVKLNFSVPLNTNPKDCALVTQDKLTLAHIITRLGFASLHHEMISPNGDERPDKATTFKIEEIPAGSDIGVLCGKIKDAELIALDVKADAAELVISMAVNSDVIYLVSLKSKDGVFPLELKTILESDKPVKIGHNLKRVVLALRKYGVELKGSCFDIMLAAYFLDAGQGKYDIETLALKYLNEYVETQAMSNLAARINLILRLHKALEQELIQLNLPERFKEVEMPLVPVLASIEERGIIVDRERLSSTGREFEALAKAHEEEIFHIAGVQFNINSPKQLSSILFQKLGLPAVRRTKTGYSTDEEVLRTLSANNPICERVLSYREIMKLKSGYVDSLLELMNPVTCRVHTSFDQTGTATGRLSSHEPNLQNIPVRTEYGLAIRSAFVPVKGYVFVSADYSQIDLRVLAHVSGDSALTEAFKSGLDIHTLTAAEVLKINPEDVTEEQRRQAKAINFGIVYGQQAYGLSQQLGLSQAEAQNYIDTYFARYSGVKTWIEKTVSFARTNGFVSTILGRRRIISGINSKNTGIKSQAERIAVNTIIQGSSADIIKLAMINIFRKIKEKSFDTHMLIQVHDDLLFEVNPNQISDLAELVRTEMEGAMTLSVPLQVELKTGPNWADMTPL